MIALSTLCAALPPTFTIFAPGEGTFIPVPTSFATAASPRASPITSEDGGGSSSLLSEAETEDADEWLPADVAAAEKAAKKEKDAAPTTTKTLVANGRRGGGNRPSSSALLPSAPQDIRVTSKWSASISGSNGHLRSFSPPKSLAEPPLRRRLYAGAPGTFSGMTENRGPVANPSGLRTVNLKANQA